MELLLQNLPVLYGLVDWMQEDKLKISCMTYRQNGEDFWAGPLDYLLQPQ